MPVVTGFNAQFVDKPWGYELIEANFESANLCLKELTIRAGMATSVHVHEKKNEFFEVLEGTLVVGDYFFGPGSCHRTVLPPGSRLYMPAGVAHQLAAPYGPVRLREISNFHSEEDTTRFSPSGQLYPTVESIPEDTDAVRSAYAAWLELHV